MRRLAATALVLLTAACTASTSGTGAGSPSAASSSRPGFPSASTSIAPPTNSVAPTTPDAPSSAPTPTTAPPTSGSSGATVRTVRTVLRPVTASGASAPGWTVRGSGDRIDCSFGEPSPVAVDPGVAFCAPSASFALACWQAGSGQTLCATDPARRILVRHPLSGPFRAPTTPDHPAPFTMTLADGSACTIRDGGTGPANLTDHPDWVAYYYCDGATAVFGPRNGTGVDTSSEPWTVRLASTEAEGAVSSVAVRTAIFLGTAPG